MLTVSGILRPELLGEAPQDVSSKGLLYAVITQFASEIEILLHEGLIKRYRSEHSNIPALKGRLLFSRHVALNITRADRWYTDHSLYDRNNPFNGILRLTLDILLRFCPQELRRRLHDIARDFIDIQPFLPNQGFMDALRFDRRSERYRDALNLAWLILRNLSPNLSSGSQNVLALLFDMNVLFESTVRSLLERESRRDGTCIRVLAKETARYWGPNYLQPDLVLQHKGRIVVVDTKWKTLGEGRIDQQDLRQVYVYGIYFGSTRVILLFPKTDAESNVTNQYKKALACPELDITCSLAYADLVMDDGSLNQNFASQFFMYAFSE